MDSLPAFSMQAEEQRHPAINWAIIVTLLRLLLLPFFLAALVLSSLSHRLMPAATLAAQDRYRWAALAIFTVMAITDKLDGYLARRLNQSTKLGVLLDPVADKLLVACSLVILCFPALAPEGFAIPWPVTLGAYLKDAGVIIGISYVYTRLGKVELKARLSGKISTAVQLALVIATLLAPDFIRVSPTATGTLLWLLWWMTVITCAITGCDYTREGARQLRGGRLSLHRPPRIGNEDQAYHESP